MLYCIAIIYVTIMHTFVNFNSPSFNQYYTVHV